MTPSRRHGAALATAGALLLLVPGRAADAQRSGADSVSLRFGWPAGMSARVEQRWSRVRSGAQRRDSSGIRTTFRLRVLDHPEGRLVVSDSFTYPGMPAPANDREGIARRLVTQIGSLSPSYVVSTRGEFRHLVDAEKIKAAVDSIFEPLFAELKDAPPQLRAMMQTALSEEALATQAGEGWNALVGGWAGRDFVVGWIYRTETEEPMPFLDGATIPMRYDYSVAGRTPCDASSAERRCVRLRLVSRPDTAGTRKMIERLMSRLGPQAADVARSLRGMAVENEIVVVAEPATLVPYSMTHTKRVRMRTAATTTNAAATMSQKDVRSLRFVYDK